MSCSLITTSSVFVLQGSLTEQLGGLVGKLQETFGNLGNTLQGALDQAGGALDNGASGRKKREEPSAEPEPGSDYYCVKRSLAGNTVRSCLPKVSSQSSFYHSF